MLSSAVVSFQLQGQGTGISLSLSYNNVKAHAGEIKVESKEGDGR
ncbi:MAG: hypothetical protein WKF88_01550 [Ferruginibacter sp.]